MKTYAPNDSSLSVEDLETLRTARGKALLQEATDLYARSSTPAVADIAHLRRVYPAPAVHAALTVAPLQAKALQKFPQLNSPQSPFVFALPEALEQATDSAVARHKASRFAAAGARHILDLCCGIGGDTMALAEVAPVTAIDLSAPRLACLRYNLEAHPPTHPVEMICTDITTFRLPQQGLFHIDPARRSGGKRSARYEDLIPGPDFLQKLFSTLPGGAIKLSPAVDFESLPDGHLEIISHNRSVVQAVLWIGSMAKQFPDRTHTATIFTDHKFITSDTAPPLPSPPEHPADGPPPHISHLYEVDPAYTRARLAHALANDLHLISLTDDGGYLADTSTAAAAHPALTPFNVLAFLPYSEKTLAAELQQHSHLAPVGAVEVKTRGKIPGIDTDRLQTQFSKAAPHRLTVLIFRSRFTGTVHAVIATRVP